MDAPDPRYTDAARRWRAVRRRDRAADGRFVYAVVTTGIYCRPGCPSRLALRRNVVFHDSPAAAERAGFRPCKRCHPHGDSWPQRRAATVIAACRRMEGGEALPSLAELAARAGLSRHHFLRVFTELVGVTPLRYAAAQRARRLAGELRSGRTITAAIYGAGFNASSRCYAQSTGLLGMTPGEFRAAGRGLAIRYAIVPCRLGLALIARTGRGVCSMLLGDDRAALIEELTTAFPAAAITASGRSERVELAAVIAPLDEPLPAAELPRDIRIAAFQQRVRQALRQSTA